jgi:hypothetical protein
MHSVPRFLVAALLTQYSLLPTGSTAQFSQQGNKLMGTGATGSASQGSAVAISSDGNTAIVGGCYDNASVGAVWAFTRSGGVWSQQGSKLVGTDAVGGSMQGISVAISGDGNTAIVGGMSDNSNTGAAWVFTRSGGVWAQQGGKLVASDAVGAAQQGISVAISADGNTAVVGGMNDDANTGAAWVYTRSGGVWSQQGNKLVGTGAVGKAWQGGVAISGDGNTLLTGGPNDNGSVGAVWVFTRSGSVWSQQGSKLVGTGSVGASLQSGGTLSYDGNTAAVAGQNDNGYQGAVWIFTRSGGVWTQQGGKLVGTGSVGSFIQQGYNITLSADGNTLIESSPCDNNYAGAVWVFTRSGGVWSQQGSKLVGTGAVGNARQGQSASLSADGSTIIIGGTVDNTNTGAAWVFVRPGSLLDGLVAYYPFNGNANDESGNGNTGTVYGSTLTADRFGSTNSAFKFISDNYIAVPHTPALNISGDMTISAWYKTSGSGAPMDYMSIVGKRDDAFGIPSSFWCVTIEVSTQRVALCLFNNFSSLDYHFSSGTIAQSTWQHVVIVVKDNTSSIYLDGRLDSSSPIAVPRPSSSKPLMIGWIRDTAPTSESFLGSIDDIRIYNRALTGVEISALDAPGSSISAPGLSVPSNGATGVAQPVSLGWGAVAGASVYHVQVASDAAFADLVKEQTNSSSTTYTLPVLAPASKFYWRVRATDGTNFSPWSTGWSFTTADTGLSNGLVAYYPFNGNANDESGSGNNGTASGATLTADRFGNLNNAYHFNGTDANIQVVAAPSLQSLSNVSVSAWINIDPGSTKTFHNILGKRSSASADFDFTVSHETPAHRVRPTARLSGVWTYFDGSTDIPKGSWHHVVMVYDGATLKSYVDGTNDGTLPATGVLSSVCPNVYIGSTEPSIPEGYFQGNIDEVRIYDRALTGVEVSALYNPASSLVAPVLLSPLNGSTEKPVPVALAWSAVSGATSYRLQVSSSSAFTSAIIDQPGITATSFDASGLGETTTYYWRVAASSGTTTSGWSAVWAFGTQTLTLPAAASMISPSNGGAGFSLPVTFRWSTAAGAKSYGVQVSTDASFTSAVVNQSGLTDTTLTPTNLLSGTTYFWKVSTANPAGSNTTTSWNFSTAFPLASPTLSSPANNAQVPGSSVSFTWTTTPGATVYHWQLATTSGFTPVVSENSSLPSTAHSYSSLASGTTYYWRVRAGDGTNWGPFASAASFSALPAHPASYSLNVNIVFPSKPKPSDFAASDYLLLGLPGNSGVKISSLFSGVAETNWRVSWDNGNASNWIVRYDGGSTFNCTSGRGFWVLNNGPLVINTSVSTATLNTKAEVEIPIHAGWNIVVNPYRTTLQWSAVQAANATNQPIYGWTTGSFNTSTVMDPFVGYYFYNAPNLTILKMPYAGLFKPAIPEVDPADWRVTITLSTAGRFERSASFAVARTDEVSTLNFRKPRSIEGVPSVWFSRPEWDAHSPSFATDVRPAGTALHSWEFTVRAEPGTGTLLGFEGLRKIPAGLAVRLLDLQRLKSVDLTQDSTYLYVPALPEERFTVLAGKPEEVRAEAETILPRRFALLNPFPNPFNPSVTIPVDLPAMTEISLTVHDILGAHVRTLHAGPAPEGRGWFVWNGKDEAGRTVASGTYLIVLRGTNVPRLTTRVVFVR